MNTEDFKSVPIRWLPGEDSGLRIKKFKSVIEQKYNLKLESYWDLHKWSIEHIPEFWEEVWNFAGVIHSKPFDEVIDMSVSMSDSPEWFKGARLNLAENLLKYRDDHLALILVGEDRTTEKVTYAQLYEEACLYGAAFRRFGLKQGDRIACYMSNRKEAVLAMLGATSIGAVCAGARPFLGVKISLKALKQIEPRILFSVDRFRNYGKEIDMLCKVEEIVRDLPSLERVVIVPSNGESKLKNLGKIKNGCFLEEFLSLGLAADGSVPRLEFEQLPFSHPVFITFTSGTSGVPKCLVHGIGSLLSSSTYLWLYDDDGRRSVTHDFAPTGGVTWNRYKISLFEGMTLVLQEGTSSSRTYILDLVDEIGITSLQFRLLYMCRGEKERYVPREAAYTVFAPSDAALSTLPPHRMQDISFLKSHDFTHTFPDERHHLRSLKLLQFGGSTVMRSNFDFAYKQVKEDIMFAVRYGATEYMGTCATTNLCLPVYEGEISAPCLGMDLQCYDEDGKAVEGKLGEVVIRRPFPSLPLGICGDKDGSLLKELYFSKYPDVFSIGDLCIINPVTRGIRMQGRSDESLNFAGWRFGSCEVYEALAGFPEVLDSVCVTQYGETLKERAVLFVKMAKGQLFSQQLQDRIRAAISKELTSRYTPSVILQAEDIPLNWTGKKLESIVRKIINGLPYDSDSVMNPECLHCFCDLPELQGF